MKLKKTKTSSGGKADLYPLRSRTVSRSGFLYLTFRIKIQWEIARPNREHHICTAVRRNQDGFYCPTEPRQSPFEAPRPFRKDKFKATGARRIRIIEHTGFNYSDLPRCCPRSQPEEPNLNRARGWVGAPLNRTRN